MQENMDFPSAPKALETRDWTYTMRRSMQEIMPGLFLGPYSAASKSKFDVLLQFGITHIVCVRQEGESVFIRPNFPDNFKYLILDVADCVTENIIQHFPKVRDFIDECLSNGGKALVHGNAGISRSAALVLSYIMEKYGLNYETAFAYVQQRRFCINPNEGFKQQLKEYEPIYRAQRTLQNGQSSKEKGRHKRRFDEVDEYSELSEAMDQCS
ncbi:serine/threonine/tyrosine-interacting protein-like [Ischnura elegans]|uniref:serine/threonine/tyrosine-interacting protein-like n=1 Tax=Ischnura elegans TaxID=197161 RepID=UPI001ED8969F|nr:serine/threonine/tyrosine-interacting protein-like [Ischnura elegans]